MDWSKGFSSQYYVSIVDPNSWRDTERIEITGGTIKRSISDLRQSADIDVVNYMDIDEALIRIWLDVTQEGASGHIPLFTGLATSPGRDINGHIETRTLQCYSVLKPAADILLPRGWYAAAGTNAVWQIQRLLQVTNANVIINTNEDHSTKRLEQAIVAEQNETNLTMVEALLTTINWRMTINGYGEIILGPYPTEPGIIFDSKDYDVIEPKIRDNYDWFSCPNVFRAISDTAYAEARDEDPDSPFSIQNRGREIWAEESSCNLYEEETLGRYATRRLKELQQVGRTISYDRRFTLQSDGTTELNATDLVQLNYPAQNIIGTFIITNQTIALGYNAKTSEEVMQI